MRIVITSIILIISAGAMAQVTDRNGWNHMTSKEDTVLDFAEMSSFYYVSSNSITTGFAQSFLNKTYIDDNLKESNLLKENNILGMELNNRISYTHLSAIRDTNGRTGFRFALVNNQFRSISFTEDIYNLAFYGNSMYAGKTASMDNSRFIQVGYNELQATYIKQFESDDICITGGAGLSLYQGFYFNDLIIYSGGLYTSETGDSLNISADISWYSSDEDYRLMTQISGLGAGMHGFFYIKNKEKNYSFGFATTGLGSIRWRETRYRIIGDTSLAYTGINVSNVLDYGDGDIWPYNQDSVNKILDPYSDTVHFIRAIPEEIMLEFILHGNKKVGATVIGASYLFHTSQPLPYFYVTQDYHIKPWLTGGIMMVYGGFGKFRIGMHFDFRYKKSELGISSHDPFGWVFPGKSCSQSLMIRAGYHF